MPVSGTRLMYLYIRQSLNVRFHSGADTLDVALAAIFNSIKQRHIADVIVDIFSALEAEDLLQQEKNLPAA